MCDSTIKKGFTLIELLVVIAIILILISIALPNFLEAQVRAKVARSKADIRSQAIALETYFNDWKNYTKDSDSSFDQLDGTPWQHRANGFYQLTTPVAYIKGRLADPFGGEIQIEGGGAQGYRIGSGSWSYPDDSLNQADNQGSGKVFSVVKKRECFITLGVGPDMKRARNAYKCFPYFSLYEGGASEALNNSGQPFMFVDYAPTNGTTSVGDLHYFGGSYRSGRFMLNGLVIGNSVSPGSGVW